MELSNNGKQKSKMVFKGWLSHAQKCLVFIFLVAATFTGCSSQSSSLSVNSIPISSQSTAALVEQKPLNLITARSGLYNHAYAGNENGCYFTVANGDGSANIMYIDYKSLSVVYLSADIQSTHNTDGDSSWIKNAIGGSTIIMLENKIGIITFGMPSRKATSNENAARIFTADLDGSNRELLYEFLPNEEIKSAIAFDGECLYFLVKAYDKMSVNQIVKLNITSKTKEIVATYPDDADYSIIGASERSLVCKTIGIPAEYSNLPVNELAQYLYTKLILVNVDTGEEEKIFEWNENLFSEIVGERIYFYSNIDKSIYQVDIKPSQNQEFLFKPLIDGEAEDFVLVGEIIDGRFFLLDKNSNNLVAITPNSKEAALFDFKNEEYNISIVANTSTDYLVITKNKNIAVSSYAPDGTPIKSNAVYPCFALIAKDDFWNASKNFKEIVYK